MTEQGKIVMADIEDGYAYAESCNHAWRLKETDTVKMYDPCPVCAEIKAAREEVLEFLIDAGSNVPIGYSWKEFLEIVAGAYRERFGG